MKVQAVLFSVAAALAGAVAWGLLTYFTQYEIGYLAWGIGVLVGLAALKGGGRGIGIALLCSVLTLCSIAGGKVFTGLFFLNDYLKQGEYKDGMHAEYDAIIASLEDVPGLQSPEAKSEFLVKHQYLAPEEEVTAEHLQDFEANVLPELEKWVESPPTFEEYAARNAPTQSEAVAFAVATSIEALGPIDLLFSALGIFSAYGIVMRKTKEELAPEPELTGEEPPA